jgi:hypothetical protein
MVYGIAQITMGIEAHRVRRALDRVRRALEEVRPYHHAA